jgi:hypothetical protein
MAARLIVLVASFTASGCFKNDPVSSNPDYGCGDSVPARYCAFEVVPQSQWPAHIAAAFAEDAALRVNIVRVRAAAFDPDSTTFNVFPGVLINFNVAQNLDEHSGSGPFSKTWAGVVRGEDSSHVNLQVRSDSVFKGTIFRRPVVGEAGGVYVVDLALLDGKAALVIREVNRPPGGVEGFDEVSVCDDPRVPGATYETIGTCRYIQGSAAP